MTTATSALTGLRLLVVEDEFLIAEFIEGELEELGCDVAGPVATIDEALAVLQRGGLDGALLDANLAGRSSAPIARAFVDAAVPFVVVTGYGGRVIPDELLEAATAGQTLQHDRA